MRCDLCNQLQLAVKKALDDWTAYQQFPAGDTTPDLQRGESRRRAGQLFSAFAALQAHQRQHRARRSSLFARLSA